jgi:hypothetical protein
MLPPISCRFSTCLQELQGKEVGYSSNSPTCALHWIWAEWPIAGFHMLLYRKCNISSRNLELKFDNRRSGEFRSMGIKWWRLRWKDTRLWFVRFIRTAALPATVAQRGILSHSGGAKEPVHLHQSDTDSWHPMRHDLHPEHYLQYPVLFRALKDCNLTMCQAEIWIHMFHFPSLILQSWCITWG